MIESERGDGQRLIHIVNACNSILDYTSGLSKEEFLSDAQVQDAVIYQLIIVGEAVNHIDENLLKKYPYPWFKIRGMRNFATHQYFNIEIWMIWEVIDVHIQELKEMVERILQKEF